MPQGRTDEWSDRGGLISAVGTSENGSEPLNQTTSTMGLLGYPTNGPMKRRAQRAQRRTGNHRRARRGYNSVEPSASCAPAGSAFVESTA
jgi:hypothetical protein